MPNATAPTKAIKLEYDGQGRIFEIYAPSEQGSGIPTVWYEYGDNAGNLTAVYKLTQKGTSKANSAYEKLSYEYQDATHYPSDHYITKIRDPRGLAPIQYVYDDLGRMIATVDAKGNRIELAHDISGRKETVKDRTGNPTIYEYDDKGNVLSVTDSQSHQTVNAYDDTNNPNKQTSVTTYVPNPENPSVDIPAVTTYVYTNFVDDQTQEIIKDKVETQAVVDPVGNLTKTWYDAIGNVTKTIVGKDTQLTPSIIYTPVAMTQNTYTDNRLVEIKTFGPGEDNQFDTTDDVLTSHSTMAYDTQTKLLTQTTQIDPLGLASDVVTTYTYNQSAGGSYDQPYSVSTSGQNQAQYFYYDADNRQVANWTYWDDPTTSAEPDKRILSINESDAQGRTIRTLQIIDTNVDDTNPQIPAVIASIQSQIDAGTARVLSETQYNSIGKVEYALNCTGRTELTGGFELTGDITLYSYDQTGNTPQTISGSYVKTYSTGNPIPAAFTYTPKTESRTLYDAEGRAIVSVGPYDPAVAGKDRVGTETVYNSLGQVEMTRKWANVAITLADVIGTGGSVVGKQATGCTSNGVALAVGNELSYNRTEYDPAGRVSKSYSLNELRNEICGSEYRYDIAGRQVKTITLPNDTTGKRSETTTQYDGSHRQSVTDGNGKTTTFEYDDLGRVITTIHPASRANDVDENGDGNFEDDITYTHVGYDGMGRKWWEAQQTTVDNYIGPGDPDFDNTDLSTGGDVEIYKSVNTKEFEYDITGRLIAVVLPPILVDDPRTPLVDLDEISVYPRTEYVYDSNGDMQAIRENLYQLNRSWEVSFNATTDILTSNVKSTTFTYDCMHRQTSRTLPGCGTEYQHYDDYGRLDWELDFREQAAGYFYDALGRLEDKKYYAADATPGDHANSNYPNSFSEIVHYTYDNLGRKMTETVTDYTGTPIVTYFAQYTYDDEGQLETIHVQHDGQEYKLEYVYSPITGRKTDTKVWKLDGGNWIEDISTDYSYDELGRLYTVTADRRNNSEINEQTSYNYDLVSNRKSTTLPNGVYTEYTYNGLNRLTDLIHYQTTQKLTTLSSFNYKMNAQGMRTGVTEVLDETRHLKYEYDNLNRLKNEYSDNKDDSNIDDPTPPSDIRGYKTNYVYDLVGNRLSRTVNVRNDSGQQDLVTTCDYYAGTDRLWHEYQDGPELAFQWGGGSVYAYANKGGGRSYQLSDMTGRIGSFTAFALGLPTEWNRWVLISLMVLLPFVYFAPVLHRFVRWSMPTRKGDPLQAPDLKLWHRCLCLLFSYIFLVGPECFQMLAYADTQYSQLSTGSWGSGNRTIEYQYDANGSMIEKRTYITGEQNPQTNYKELISYEYNLQNRLSKATTTTYVDIVPQTRVAIYKYNPDGIRIFKRESAYETDYIIDPYNHTGYAQVIEETSCNLMDTSNSKTRIQYTIGDDIISQTRSAGEWNAGQMTWTASPTQYFLYDGHGSTRQLVTADLTNQSSYSYDGYGVLLRDVDSFPSQIVGPPLPGGSGEGILVPATNYLYCGEQYDAAAQSYYLRARYYDPMNGRFNQMDPYSGNNEDPQSLHKYLYAAANPVNSIDPSGLWTICEVLLTTITAAALIYTFGPPVLNVLECAKQFRMLSDFGLLINKLTNQGVIDFSTQWAIRQEASKATTNIIKSAVTSMQDIALEIAKMYVYSLAFGAVTEVALGGIGGCVQLSSQTGSLIVKAGNDVIEEHHLVFKCALKDGLKKNVDNLFDLTRSQHRLKPDGLHVRIANSQRFAYLQPGGTRKMTQILKRVGRQKWLDDLGECYKWLETDYPGDYKGIYEAYQKAVQAIGGTSGLI